MESHNWLPSIKASPCDSCEQALRCRIQLLSCRQFAYYQRRGQIDPDLPRAPSRQLFRRLFAGDLQSDC